MLQLTKILNDTYRALTSGAAANKPLAVLDLQMPSDRRATAHPSGDMLATL